MDSTQVSPASDSLALPVAAIVCIAVGAYILLIILILIIRSILQSHGICSQACNCCGKENQPCCQCCAVLSDTCNCVQSPNLSACLDSICPSRKRMDCADFITCQCCADPNNQCCTCCNSQEPLCDCGQCNCNCACTAPDCQDVNCLCFKIQSKAIPAPEDDE